MSEGRLGLQRKSCRVTLGIEGVKDGKVTKFLPKDFDIRLALNELSQYGLRYYGIIHDKDLTVHDYNHIHLVLIAPKIMRFSQFVSMVSNAFQCEESNVNVRETTVITSNIQYLVHKGIAGKYHYQYDEVFTNDSIDNLNAILESEVIYDETFTTDTLVSVISRCHNGLELITELGISYFNRNIRTIQFICKQLGKESFFL